MAVDANKKYYYMALSQVNRRVNPYLMKDDELWDSVNWWTESKVGSKKVRPGYKAYLDQIDSNPVRGLFYVKFPDKTTRLVRLSGKNVYAVDPNVASSWGSAKYTISGSNWFRPEATALNAILHIVSQPSSTESHYLEGKSNDVYTEPNYTQATAAITVAPSPATTGTTFSVSNTDAAKFLDPQATGNEPYNCYVFAPGSNPTIDSSTETVTITAKGSAGSGGGSNTQFTITRNIDGGGAISIGTGYTIIASDPIIPYMGLTVAMYHRRVYTGSGYDPGGSGLYSSWINWSAVDYQNKGVSNITPWTTQTTLTDSSFAFNTPVDKDYAGSVIHLSNINDRLNIYKEEGIYIWNETSLFDIFGLSAIQGTIATNKETKTDFFLTNEGFFKSDGNSATPIGEGYYEILKQIFQNTTTVLDPTQFHSFSVNFLYFCYLGTVGYDGKVLNNACFVYNAYYNEIYLLNFGHHLTCFGYYVNNQKEKVIVAGDVNGNTYQFDYSAATNDDAGIAIEASLKTKYFFYDSPEQKNNISQFYEFLSLSSEVETYADRNFEGEYKYFVSHADNVVSKAKRDPSDIGQFNVLSFEVQWNGKGKRPELYGLIPNIVQNSERFQKRG